MWGRVRVHGPRATGLNHTKNLCLCPSVRAVPCYLPAPPPRALCIAIVRRGRTKWWQKPSSPCLAVFPQEPKAGERA